MEELESVFILIICGLYLKNSKSYNEIYQTILPTGVCIGLGVIMTDKI